jgi:hypothetical protein
MKKIYTIFLVAFFSANVFAQNGIKFDPHIPIDFTKVDEIQVTKLPIKTQVLFTGGTDMVTSVDSLGKPNGLSVSKIDNDFIGITPDGNDFWISVNHETKSPNTKLGGGGGMSSFKVMRSGDSLKVIETTLPDGRTGKFHNVDFINTVGPTVNNCGGMISPEGEIWTAEEYPDSYSPNSKFYATTGDSMDVMVGFGKIKPFLVKNRLSQYEGKRIKAFENNGYMVRIDPKTGKALQKQYNWGRMSFEAGAISADNKTVYLAEDGTPGMFTKFVADVAGDFSKGSLYVFNQNATGANGHWIKMDNTNLKEMIYLADSAYKRGATAFIRLEWIIELNGKIYICETGLDNPSGLKNAITAGGNVAKHHIDRAAAKGQVITGTEVTYKDYYGRILEYDPATDMVKSYLEGGPEHANQVSDSTTLKGGNYPAIHLSNPDGLGKITINNKKYMIICEDLNGNTYNRLPNDYKGTNNCEMYLLDASIANPSLNDLIRIAVGPKGAELTGGNGTPDGKTILINVQHPSSNIAPFNGKNGVTYALTGWNTVADIKNTSFLVDWTKTNEFQPAKGGIKTQVLFVGGIDQVTAVGANGKPNGLAVSKVDNDFIGITPDENDYWITINHETKSPNAGLGGGGGMTTFKVVRDADSLKVVTTTLPDGRTGLFHNVDFANTVGETVNNCGGMIGPNGEIWTAEEYPGSYSPNTKFFNVTGDSLDVVIGYGKIMPYLTKNALSQYNGQIIKAYENNGYMVKIDPKTGKALQKQYNWGRMSFEGAAMSSDKKTVYMAEDGTPGLFTRFVADVAGDFTKGSLYVFNQNATGANGHWIKMNNNDLKEMIHLGDSAYKRGATAFVRLEWLVEVNGKIYICETGLDNPSGLKNAITKGGNVAKHHMDRATAQGGTITATEVTYHDYYGRILVYDPTTDMISSYLEGGPEYANSESQAIASYPSIHLSNPDGLGKIKINGKDYLVIQEDLNGATYNRLPNEAKSNNTCEMFLLDLSIAKPQISDLKRIFVGPKGAEITGGNGTPDGKTILVNVQHPNAGVEPYVKGRGVTIALTGWDLGIQTATDDIANDSGFIIYPNPAVSELFFNGTYDIALYNMNGVLVKTSYNVSSINISDLSSGVYFVKNGKGDIKKLIIE